VNRRDAVVASRTTYFALTTLTPLPARWSVDRNMVTKEDIEGFLDRLAVDGASYTEIQPGMWIVRPGGDGTGDVVVHYSPPVVLLRMKVMDLPSDELAVGTLARRLLQLNASELLHGSYGIEGNAVVLTEAMELAHLDYEEFLAAYESMTLALASLLRELAPFREAH
jgi:hypothetical protein